MSGNRCVFFDRDGIVNESPGPGYVERWEDFKLQPAFVESCRIAIEAGYGCAIISNQRGVARGIMTMATLDSIHSRLLETLREEGVELLGIYVCPHERDSCNCRKPSPGMLLKAAREHALKLSLCWMVGDQPTDVEAGVRAGCHTVLVNGDLPQDEAEFQIDDMSELPDLLRRLL